MKTRLTMTGFKRARAVRSSTSAFALLTGLLLTLPVTGAFAQADTPTPRPNILVITADDMGYTDIASFGGEIRTPNLDSVALSGVRLTNFHVGPACSQTRTMMMSGTYTEVGGTPGRSRVIRDEVVALPQHMQDAGYRTYMSGKWHLGTSATQNPKARGFDSSFVLTPGSAEHFYYGSNATNPKLYMENGEFVKFPEDAYSTELYTDKMLSFLKANEGDKEPFFAWYSPTSPHWPIQVPDDYLHLYDGAYDLGYDDLLRKRLQRAQQMGVLQDGYSLENYPRRGKDWDTLTAEEQRYEARIMELYAAMVENFDYHVGRLISYLKETGQYENTLIVFSSDNGSDPRNGTNREGIDNSYENLGRANSYAAIGGWADIHTAPYRYQKGTQSEGGVRAPAFIHYPTLGNQGGIDNRFITIMDFMPTFLELAGAERPDTEYKGKEVLPIAGVSFADLVNGAATTKQHSSGSDAVWYSQALYKDEWKLTKTSAKIGWELFNLRLDPSETTNLAAKNPEKMKELMTEWQNTADRVGYAGGANDGPPEAR
jgi:arylsulfatase